MPQPNVPEYQRSRSISFLDSTTNIFHLLKKKYQIFCIEIPGVFRLSLLSQPRRRQPKYHKLDLCVRLEIDIFILECV